MLDKLIYVPGRSVHAPHLLDVEVAQTVRRFTLGGEIDADIGQRALVDLADFPIRRYPHDALLPRIWSLRENLSAYDAAYVALAEALDAPLLTLDQRLAGAARKHSSVTLLQGR